MFYRGTFCSCSPGNGHTDDLYLLDSAGSFASINGKLVHKLSPCSYFTGPVATAWFVHGVWVFIDSSSINFFVRKSAYSKTTKGHFHIASRPSLVIGQESNLGGGSSSCLH